MPRQSIETIYFNHNFNTQPVMQLISTGDFYMGIDKEEYCQFDIHLGRLRVEYSCPSFNKDDGPQPSKEDNRR